MKEPRKAEKYIILFISPGVYMRKVLGFLILALLAPSSFAQAISLSALEKSCVESLYESNMVENINMDFDKKYTVVRGCEKEITDLVRELNQARDLNQSTKMNEIYKKLSKYYVEISAVEEYRYLCHLMVKDFSALALKHACLSKEKRSQEFYREYGPAIDNIRKCHTNHLQPSARELLSLGLRANHIYSEVLDARMNESSCVADSVSNEESTASYIDAH